MNCKLALKKFSAQVSQENLKVFGLSEGKAMFTGVSEQELGIIVLRRLAFICIIN
jgi:hypothetical protein